eukprot:XP_011663474.1 PREDICTED: uncharacterized protein LOC105437957 [Strongylocentrotus purpuratus]
MVTLIPASILLLLTTILHPTSGCDCAGEPIFCYSGFGVKGKVTNIRGNVTTQGNLIYSVRISEVYRNSSEGIYVDDTIEINTRLSCGFTDLQENVAYLLSGDFVLGSYHLHVCRSIVVAYNDYIGSESSHEDVDIPCSARSLMASSALVVFIVALFNLIFFH